MNWRATYFKCDARGSDVYHACAAFKDKGSRKQNNALGARCFWLDVDVGEGKPYRDQQEAAESVIAFCKIQGLPIPIFVSSGYGLHVYWPLDRMLSPDEWKSGASRLKSACKVHGLMADESRTTDISSVLRPPGTHNRKIPSAPRLVQAGPLVGPYNAESFLSRLGVVPSLELQPESRKALSDAAGAIYSPSSYSDVEMLRLRSALACIPADDRGIWLQVGMALHRTGWGEPAYRLWDDWSRTAPKKYEEAMQRKTWESFARPYEGPRVTVATIFHLAKERGWTDNATASPRPVL